VPGFMARQLIPRKQVLSETSTMSATGLSRKNWYPQQPRHI